MEPLKDFVSANLLFQIDDTKSIQSTDGLTQSLDPVTDAKSRSSD